VWKAPPSIECEANLGIWADDGLVFAPCSGGIIRIHDATTGRVIGIARPPADGRPRLVLEVTYRNGLLYAATATHGLLIFDVTTPAQPRLAGRFEVRGPEGSPEIVVNIHNVTLSADGRLAYLINQSHAASDMRIVDVSNPAQPTEVGRYTVATGSLLQGVHDVYLTERNGRTYAYVNRLSVGLEVLDVTDPAAPTLVGSFKPGTASHSGWFFEAKGQHYFAHTDEGFDQGLTVLNVDDVTKPQFTSVYRKRPGISIHNIRVVDGIAYIAYYVDGLVVLDLRDPARIAELAYYDTIPNGEERGLFSGAWGVHVDDGLIFMSDMDSGLYAFRLTAR
jgi:choice-of-anchor B domain-containing protein